MDEGQGFGSVSPRPERIKSLFPLMLQDAFHRFTSYPREHAFALIVRANHTTPFIPAFPRRVLLSADSHAGGESLLPPSGSPLPRRRSSCAVALAQPPADVVRTAPAAD